MAAFWDPSPRRPHGTGRRGMVSTSSPLAAMAGMRAFDRGGNAADAALAAAAVLAVVEPNQSGLGGDLFALIVRDGEPPIGLNASGRAPAEPGALLPAEFGPTSVTVPGCVSGWTEIAGRCSRLGLEAAVLPAAELAEHGFSIAPRNLIHWLEDWELLDGDAATHFAASDPFRNPPMAQSLRAAAGGTFYTGPCGEAIVEASWLAESDLQLHTTDWVEPVGFEFRGHTLLELPPNGQGSIAGWALESLADDLSPAAQIDALVAAYERGYASIGGTSYVCAADGEGMAVSLIQSIYYGFGSHVIAPGCGFMLQNRGAGFVFEPGHPNQFAAGKRPFHTIMPGALLGPDGRWQAVLGVTGGQYQPQGHLQVAVNLVAHGMDPQTALDQPRYRLEEDWTVGVEPPLEHLLPTFGDRDAHVADDLLGFGNGHVIDRTPDGQLRGGTEPRRDGVVLGY
jgi:gamma-glutamyltranspeptidase / glutathione hydrolase